MVWDAELRSQVDAAKPVSHKPALAIKPFTDYVTNKESPPPPPPVQREPSVEMMDTTEDPAAMDDDDYFLSVSLTLFLVSRV